MVRSEATLTAERERYEAEKAAIPGRLDQLRKEYEQGVINEKQYQTNVKGYLNRQERANAKLERINFDLASYQQAKKTGQNVGVVDKSRRKKKFSQDYNKLQYEASREQGKDTTYRDKLKQVDTQ